MPTPGRKRSSQVGFSSRESNDGGGHENPPENPAGSKQRAFASEPYERLTVSKPPKHRSIDIDGLSQSQSGTARSTVSKMSSVRSNDSYKTRMNKSLGRNKVLRAFNRIPLLARLLIILSVPVVFLAIESGLALSKVITAINHRGRARDMEHVAHLVAEMEHAIQLERSATAAWLVCPSTDAACLLSSEGALSKTVSDRTEPARDSLSEFATRTSLGRSLSEDFDWQLASRSLAALTDHRELVSARVRSGRDALDFYTTIIDALVSTARRFPREVHTALAANELNVFAALLTINEQFAWLSSYGAIYWPSGVPNPADLDDYHQHLKEISVLSDFAIGTFQAAEVETYTEIMENPATRATLRNFASVSTNDTVVMGSIPRADFLSNATVAIGEIEALEVVVEHHVGAAGRESFAADTAVVVTAIVVTTLTCTVLTYALVKSVRAQQSAMEFEIQKRKKTDASVRKFFPSRFMSLIDVVDVNAVVPGLRSEMLLTSLFCDIRGFTELSEQMTPDEVFNFLLEFTELVTPIIASNNGYIDKYIGDAFLAVFVEPENAIVAAIEVQAAVTRFNVTRRSRVTREDRSGSLPYGSTETNAVSMMQELTDMRMQLENMKGLRGTRYNSNSGGSIGGNNAQAQSPHLLPGQTPATPVNRKMSGDLPPVGDTMTPPVAPRTTRKASVASNVSSTRSSLLPRTSRQASRVDDVHIGIGIHQGMCILGTLGNDRRIDGTIIGDSVNVASRLEGLCSTLGADIIVSEDTLMACRSAGVRFSGLEVDFATCSSSAPNHGNGNGNTFGSAGPTVGFAGANTFGGAGIAGANAGSATRFASSGSSFVEPGYGSATGVESMGEVGVRRLGPFRLKGRRNPVEIYEVTHTNEPWLRSFKAEHRETFDRAMALMNGGNDQAAKELLESIRNGAPVVNDPIVDARLDEIEERQLRAARTAAGCSDN